MKKKPKQEKFCENQFCEAEAVTQVQVSIKEPNDEWRSLCSGCMEVYLWGVQHGTRLCGGYELRQDLKITSDHIRVFFSEPVGDDAKVAGYFVGFDNFQGTSTPRSLVLKVPKDKRDCIMGMKLRDLRKMGITP